ncbi:ArsA family ATPase [Corynebacterium sp. L4756]|uniref:ArsA family ATPase n=1 Tax=unclassified Corynebacterium TaxID=2624378 RepID=UPI00374CB825
MFFGGKGGVGKTTIANATALQLSASATTLVVSTDPAHNVGHLWDTKVGDVPTAVRPGIDVLELDPARATQEHLQQAGDTMRRMMPEHLHKEVKKHLHLAEHSPGTHEAAMLERIAILLEDYGEKYDHIIFDTAPSGHTARLMALPELMSAWTDGLLERRAKSEKFSDIVRGMSPTGKDRTVATAVDPVDRRNQELRSILLKRRRRFEQLRAVLTDATRCQFHIVLTAERLPVLETDEFHAELNANGVHVGALIVNRRSPADQGEFLASRRKYEDEALADLQRRLPKLDVIEIPLRAHDVGSPQALEEIASFL